MERYIVTRAQLLPTIRLHLLNRHNELDEKDFDVSVGDFLSILYIDNLYEIGDGKEYVIHCRVIDIKFVDITTNKFMKHGIYLLVDAGEKCRSDILELDIDKILDIHRYKFDYDLNENPIIIPDKLTDGFIVNEVKHPQHIDVTIPLDPLIGDVEYTEEGENNE